MSIFDLKMSIADIILGVADEAEELTRSDLQGRADAEALKILELVLEYIRTNL